MNILKFSFLMIAMMGAAILLGFYFTMSVSIMPGFDTTEPFAAIVANQDIGRTTQKSLFFLALIGTPLAILISIPMHRSLGSIQAWLVIALLGWVAMFVVTLTLNVPLNQILDGLDISPDQSNLEELWQAYSIDWQKWNWLRVLASAVSIFAMTMAVYRSE